MTPDQPPSAAADVFRAASRQFATGVTVATAREGDVVHGITATAFCPLSLDPPLVLLALDSAGRLISMARASGHFGVSILAAGQQGVSEWAARHGRTPGAALPEVDVEDHGTVPLLRGAIACFECVVESETQHGDHALLVGRVTDAWIDETQAPLLYFRGEHHDIGVLRPRSG